MASRSQTVFAAVRFGNVLASNGSVVPRFLAQIKAGGPVTVTDPEVSRYFMLIPEAVQLVLHAACFDDSGAVYVLDMGEPIKLVEMARNLIRLCGYVPDEEIPIRFVGLRAGEKLFEELVGPGEEAVSSGVEKILRLRGSAVADPAKVLAEATLLEQVAGAGQHTAVLRELRALVPSTAWPCRNCGASDLARTSVTS
jgi:FlaA1/EpsC-like NDP-sugar epimerase